MGQTGVQLLINAMHAVQDLEQPEVSIRRRPPEGLQHQPCGNQFQFEVHQTADNKPRNILEEIVWCALGTRTCAELASSSPQALSARRCCVTGRSCTRACVRVRRMPWHRSADHPPGP